MGLVQKHPTLVVDLVGSALLLVFLSLFLSFTVLSSDDTTNEIVRLERNISQGTRALTELRVGLDQSRDQLQRNRETLDQHGKLPEHAPIDEYFRFLSRLADHHELRVLSHYPLGVRRYPGLLEQRFSFEVIGSLPDLARFFKDIEDSDYWADVGFLKITRPQAVPGADPRDRQAQLTLCLFSADSIKEPSSEEG